MSRTSAIVWGAVILAGVVVVCQGAHQDWELQRSGDGNQMRFTVKKFEPGHGKWSSTFDTPFQRFRGLSLDTVDGGGKAQFEYVQDAGKLVCEGGFRWGRGSGSFRFVPNPRFASELKSLGYDVPPDEALFSMMLSGISLDFAREAKEAGLQTSIEQLADLQRAGVTLEFIRDARRDGYSGLSARDYIDLHTQGVRTGFLRELKDAGYDLSAQEVISLQVQGINGEFLRQLKSYGLHPKASELVQLRVQGVTPQYLEGLQAAGYSDLSANEIVSLHLQGVRAEFIQAARDLGYRFTPRELVELRNNGVDAGYLRRLHESGMRTLSAMEITKLKQNGVD
jgi:hypothetical protein